MQLPSGVAKHPPRSDLAEREGVAFMLRIALLKAAMEVEGRARLLGEPAAQASTKFYLVFFCCICALETGGSFVQPTPRLPPCYSLHQPTTIQYSMQNEAK